ncbi:MAG: hypothetical protein Ct9H300mP28_04740 [Pseudomonadota bacterium]|nr:MAG: hypothetical protein Ct9H300mP28_04740 [Pseudomonadota bacterium]
MSSPHLQSRKLIAVKNAAQSDFKPQTGFNRPFPIVTKWKYKNRGTKVKLLNTPLKWKTS